MTDETVSSVASRFPVAAVHVCLDPSLSACKNSLAVDLFRRSISGQQRRKTPSDCCYYGHFGEKVKACAEQNIFATQEFFRDLSYAKDIQDMLRIQMEFMRSQLETFDEHDLLGSNMAGLKR